MTGKAWSRLIRRPPLLWMMRGHWSHRRVGRMTPPTSFALCVARDAGVFRAICHRLWMPRGHRQDDEKPDDRQRDRREEEVLFVHTPVCSYAGSTAILTGNPAKRRL